MSTCAIPYRERVDRRATRSWRRRRDDTDRRWRELRAASSAARSNTTNLLTTTICRERQKSVEVAALSAVAKISLSVLVRRLWACLVVDELPGGNHRRGRAGATPGGGAYGAYRCATNGGGGWGPGHTGNVGAAHTSRPFASERFSPRAPAPAAPPLPARRATHRSKPDGSARESRRSMFPSTCRLR